MEKRQVAVIDRIEKQAAKLGVSSWARQKWRERSAVPAKWQVAIVRSSYGRIKLADFDLYALLKNDQTKGEKNAGEL